MGMLIHKHLMAQIANKPVPEAVVEAPKPEAPKAEEPKKESKKKSKAE